MSHDKEERKNIAKRIIDQLGGMGALTAMTGAKNFLALDAPPGVSFKLPRGFAKNGMDYIKIELMPSDTYNVIIARINHKATSSEDSLKDTQNFDDVYAEELAEIFSDTTGLTLNVPTLLRMT